MKILVAEDDEELRSALAMALSGDGADVVEACNGAVAERLLEDELFDVVVTDIRMPGRSGLELLHGMRSRGSAIPVILMSGFADAEAIAGETPNERSLLFSKPFDIDDLRTAILNIDAYMTVGHERRPVARGHVLLAEDNDELRYMVADALQAHGFVVQTAADGAAALELLERAMREEIPMPDVVVMDVRMPRYNGLDVLRALRLSRISVPVVLMTAFPDPDTLQTAASLGAACTLAKPLDDIEDVVHAVSVVAELARRRARPQSAP